MRILLLIFPLLVGCDLEFLTGEKEKEDPVPIAQVVDVEQVNPDIALTRTYWKVYSKSQTPVECYMVPRPDNVTAAATACADSGSIHDLLVNYQMCQENPDVDIINALNCADAKEIQTYLHTQLVFAADDPFLYNSDRSALCSLATCANDAEMDAYCEYYQSQYDAEQAGKAVPAIARLDSDVEKTKAAACANELYGIDPN